jgi:hypothetical protein
MEDRKNCRLQQVRWKRSTRCHTAENDERTADEHQVNDLLTQLLPVPVDNQSSPPKGFSAPYVSQIATFSAEKLAGTFLLRQFCLKLHLHGIPFLTNDGVDGRVAKAVIVAIS